MVKKRLHLLRYNQQVAMHKYLYRYTFQKFPQPFVIPAFRHATENNLKEGILKDSDRRYMVQTLATLAMSYVPSPSCQDCLTVSKALHAKFPFLKEDDSEVQYLPK